MMKLSITSLTHPSLLAKIRLGMRLAALGKGEQMNGHGNRAYVQNRHGHNVMRINWLPKQKTWIVYGPESTDITEQVRQAFARHRLAMLVARYDVEAVDCEFITDTDYKELDQ